MKLGNLLDDLYCGLYLKYVYNDNKIKYVPVTGLDFNFNAEGMYITSRTLEITYLDNDGDEKCLSLVPVKQTDNFINYFKEIIVDEIKAFDKKHITDVTAKKTIEIEIKHKIISDIQFDLGENNCFIYIENKQILAFQVNEIHERLIKCNDQNKDTKKEHDDTFTKLKLFMESIVSNSDSMISHLDLPDVDNIQVKFKNGIIIDKTILDAE